MKNSETLFFEFLNKIVRTKSQACILGGTILGFLLGVIIYGPNPETVLGMVFWAAAVNAFGFLGFILISAGSRKNTQHKRGEL